MRYIRKKPSAHTENILIIISEIFTYTFQVKSPVSPHACSIKCEVKKNVMSNCFEVNAEQYHLWLQTIESESEKQTWKFSISL